MPSDVRVQSPPPKPLLIYDGDCRFCTRWAKRWRNATGDAVDYIPSQDPSVAARFPEITPDDFSKAVYLIEPDGAVSSGAEAVFRTLDCAGRDRWLLKFYNKYDGFAVVADMLYGEVAQHREFLSKLDRIYCGPGTEPLRYLRVRFLFMRGLALIYLIAFGSLFVQMDGLMGSHGIAPARWYMQTLNTQAQELHAGPFTCWRVVPTLAWWFDSDAALKWQCGSGIALSVLLLLGIAPAIALFLLWLLYLSLCSVGSPFMDFQWDMLLLETGFLAIFFAPWQWRERPSRQSAPSATVIWLLRWLTFRLMFESGCVKLMSADFSWWNLSALRYHYQTQPLPTWIGWYAHQLPSGFQSTCVFLLFAIEIIVPVFIFAGRRLRLLAAGLFILLQAIIMLTGNYCFFNWLAILLCLPLLDDLVLKRRGIASAAPASLPPAQRSKRWPRLVVVPLAVLIVLVTFMELLSTMNIRSAWPASVIALFRGVQPFRSANGYGLFATMTRARPEIIVQGSDDEKTWKDYEFKYKPGDLKGRPAFVAPYQPRLDWQTWFAALESPRENPWLIAFAARLLHNEPAVLHLLKNNPFPNAPPKFIRAELYEYRFTDRAVKKKTGDWWQRDYIGMYLPPLSKEMLKLPDDSPAK